MLICIYCHEKGINTAVKIMNRFSLEANTFFPLSFGDAFPFQEGWGTRDCDGFVGFCYTAAFWHSLRRGRGLADSGEMTHCWSDVLVWLVLSFSVVAHCSSFTREDLINIIISHTLFSKVELLDFLVKGALTCFHSRREGNVSVHLCVSTSMDFPHWNNLPPMCI